MSVVKSLLSCLVLILTLVTAMDAGPLAAQTHLRQIDAAFIEDHDNVSVSLDYLPQERVRYTIEDLLEDQKHPLLPWKQNTSSAPGFGFDTHPYWFRLVVICFLWI